LLCRRRTHEVRIANSKLAFVLFDSQVKMNDKAVPVTKKPAPAALLTTIGVSGRPAFHVEVEPPF
jgi:hypothetical protein